MDKPVLYIVVPCYNEEEVLPETAKRLSAKLAALTDAGKVSADSRILFVDDGSRDRTWELIREYHEADERFSGVKLSRNRGHQNALLAGLMTAKDPADAVVSMDADLQDDINAVDGMVDKFLEGCDVVYGVRSARDTDTFFKRFTAEGFYKLMELMGAEVVFNHADYRLLSKRALEALSEYKEVNLFLRGIVPMIGFQSDTVEYERGERFAGESKYPLKKMLAFALDGVTSLSDRPIQGILGLGALTFAGGLAAIPAGLKKYRGSEGEEDFSLLLSNLWAVSGLVLTSVGIIGDYVGKVYLETKARPRYFIAETLNSETKK
ncbi:MAG: glycosyltransferase family 2 protein [Clostridia bacterium]|nr:glycosyltransferase family 2 protein [Clostridia bacterium]